MGIRLAALEGAEFDSIFHLDAGDGGVRPAAPGTTACAPRCAWRDGPYTTGPAADHDAAIRRHR